MEETARSKKQPRWLWTGVLKKCLRKIELWKCFVVRKLYKILTIAAKYIYFAIDQSYRVDFFLIKK